MDPRSLILRAARDIRMRSVSSSTFEGFTNTIWAVFKRLYPDLMRRL